jgi:Ca-activated chloride channel family protein
VEGGEIGSGQSITVAFEIEPNFASGTNVYSDHFAEVKLQYKLPGETAELEMSERFPYDPILFKDLHPMYRFASSVIMFGSILKSSQFVKDISWGDVLFNASEAANPTDVNQSQLVELIYKAKDFYTKRKE